MIFLVHGYDTKHQVCTIVLRASTMNGILARRRTAAKRVPRDKTPSPGDMATIHVEVVRLRDGETCKRGISGKQQGPIDAGEE